MAGEKNSKYKEEYDQLAYNYSLLGAIDKKLAEFFDVSVATINNWKIEHPSFLESTRKGKHQADAMVAKSLFSRAIGVTITEEKQEDGTNGSKTTTTTKEIAPDTAAASLWLRNRQPDLWRDKKEMVIEESSLTPWESISGGSKE